VQVGHAPVLLLRGGAVVPEQQGEGLVEVVHLGAGQGCVDGGVAGDGVRAAQEAGEGDF